MKDFGTRTKLLAVLFSLTTMLGCGALEAGSPTGQSASGLVTTSADVDFGSVAVGTTTVKTNVIVNNTKSTVVVTRPQVSQSSFTISGQTFPLTLAPGQHATLQISFSPQNDGSSQSRVVLASSGLRFPTIFTLRGTAILHSRMRLTPASISFGNVPVGKTQTQAAILSNPGTTAITVTRAAISGTGFALAGLSLPLKLQGGQSATINVSFTPVSGGAATGTISVVGAVSLNAPRRPFTGRGDDFTPTQLTTVALNTMSTSLNAQVSGSGMGGGQLAISPSSLALGNVKVGGSQSRSATLTNSGGSDLTISQATITGKGFRMTGLTFPLTLAAGQSKSFAVIFTPLAAGGANGSIVVSTDSSNTVNLPVSAMATASGALISNPSSLSFGSVQVGQSQTLSAALTNSGGSTVTVFQASVSASGFTVGGLKFPLTLAAGQSTPFTVIFKPQSGGSASAAISFSSDASDGGLTVSLAGTAVTAGSIASSPASLNFGVVQAGTPKTISETLINTGGVNLTISQAKLSGAGFTVKGLTLPLTLAAGRSMTFSVTFMSASGGGVSGGLAITSNGSNSTLNIPLSANVATAGVLSTSDSSLDFGSVPVNGSGTQPETLTNTGGANVTITQARVSGTPFSVTGLSLPLTLAPGQSFTFGTAFKPTSGGGAVGSIAVASDASNSALTITMAGTASVAGQLAVNPPALNFGTVTVGQSKSLTASLTATGSSITISKASLSTSEFTVTGISLPLTLAPGKSVSFTISFKPQSSGVAGANGSFTSNAANASVAQALTGTGAAAPQHSVALTWNPSASSVVGYNVYRGSASGGPYSKITSLNADTSYVDTSVQSGQTYFYVATSVDGSGKESANSGQTQASIPTP